MQVELPQDIIERVQKLTASGYGANDAEVIRMALDSLDWRDQERIAVQRGIDAWRAGDVQEFNEFDRGFRAHNGISADA
jgi:Arc/MetJ-type ribon-helix-helix transcriptional regulator